jgi:hypothetical protein
MESASWCREGRSIRQQKVGGQPGRPPARRTRTVIRSGRIPTLVICSRNERPRKGLVLWPHLDQHGFPFQERERKRAHHFAQGIEPYTEPSKRPSGSSHRLIVLRTVFKNLFPTEDPRSRFFWDFDVSFRLFHRQIILHQTFHAVLWDYAGTKLLKTRR